MKDLARCHDKNHRAVDLELWVLLVGKVLILPVELTDHVVHHSHWAEDALQSILVHRGDAPVAIYEFAQSTIVALQPATFGSVNILERRDLQRSLRESIGVIAPDTLVISEEFGEWEESKRRIDLLGIDRDANLVVIELKRTEDGGHMELQAIRYASMVSTMTFDRAVEVFADHLRDIERPDDDPRATLLDFLGWDEVDEDRFAQDVRIVLASAEFSRELTSAVMWLIDHGVDIRCVRLKPYNLDGRVLVDVQQIIPLPEAAEYQVQIREKVQKVREARASGADRTPYDVSIEGKLHPAMRKRHAIFLIARLLSERGITPEEIAQPIKRPLNRIWYFVDGEVDAEEFVARAMAKSAAGGPRFDARRWFGQDGELFRIDGKTYAFSDQWGGARWMDAMNALRARFPDLKLEFKPAA